MMPSSPRMREVTQLLHELGDGDDDALDQLFSLVYDELLDLAHMQRLRWQGEHTLNTTALVHEAYERLSGGDLDLENRKHFMRVAAKAMRYVLLDHARAKSRQKRGGDQQRVPFDEALSVSYEEAEELIELDNALQRLEENNERQSAVVECRFFAGMTIDETAAVLDVSAATVKRDWRMARAWLYREMRRDE
jgi:RNA polymerase sigma factor (TIGR02999 family)